jgi:hypothetical protein
MFKITFEAKTMEDLQNQVNELVGTHNKPQNSGVERYGNVMTEVSKIPCETLIDNVFTNMTSDSVAVPNPVDSDISIIPEVVESTETQPQAEPQSPAPLMSPDFNVEVDSQGIPWDHRIHSSSKTIIKSGTWKKRKGVAKEVYDSVMAKLVARVTQPPVDLTPAPPVPGTPSIDPQPVTSQPPVDLTPAPVPMSNKPAHNFDTFKANFIGVVGNLMQEGKIDLNYVNSLNQHFGVEEFFMIRDKEDAVRELYDNFCSFGFITKVD